MIELTIDNKQVVLPADASISIEKTSPVLNEKTGTFSYPFPVPTDKNASVLGFPGRLERADEISSKNFILKEDGVQVLRGQIDFDTVTASETGLILQSGANEFNKLMEGKKLSDLDIGKQSWITAFTQSGIQTKLDGWNLRNMSLHVNEYVVLEFAVKDKDGNQIIVNEHTNVSGASKLVAPTTGTDDYFTKFYCLQFGVGWLLQKVFEAANYRVEVNEINDSVFKDVVVFSKITKIFREGIWVGTYELDEDGNLNISPGSTLVINTGWYSDYLYYSDILPDHKVLDFIAAVKSLLCLTIDIDERLKKVSIYFNKSMFQPENMVPLSDELVGWEHSEQKYPEGFTLKYTDQDDDLGTESDFDTMYFVDTKSDLPPADEDFKEKVAKVNDTGRYYICQHEDIAYVWNEIGRLKSYVLGDGEKEFEIDARVPPQVTHGDIDIPAIDFMFEGTDNFTDIGQLAFSFSRGIHTVNDVQYKLLSFDRYSSDGNIDFATSLKPNYLYGALYKDFMNWQTYKACEVVKYLKISLPEIIALQWGKRYIISGVPIILNKINLELPHKGTVKIEGFTA